MSIKKPIFYSYDLCKKTAVDLLAIIHVDDRNTEVLEVAVTQGGEAVSMTGKTVIARFVSAKDHILFSDNVACSVNEAGNILVPFDNAVIQSRKCDLKIEVKIADGTDVLTLQFPLWVRVNGSILDTAEISPESQGTIPELLRSVREELERVGEYVDKNALFDAIDTAFTGGGTLVPSITIDNDNQSGDYILYYVDGDFVRHDIFNFTEYLHGAKGDKGDQGVQGETGNGIASIEKTGTSGGVDTYTITMTDGTTYDFTVTNGEDIGAREEITALKEDLKNTVVNKNGVNEVTPQNLQIVDAVISKNLYDPESVSQGYMRKDGSIAGVDFTHTDYIPVVAGDYYYFSQYMNDRQLSMSVHNVCCFDSNKNVLPDLGTDVSFEGLYLVPEGVSFIRTSNYKHISYSKWQIEHGNEMTEYEPYGLLSAVIKDEFIPPVSIGQIPAFRLVEGQNILNRNDPDFASGFLNTNGTISDYGSYMTSGFIPVQPGDRLIGSYKTNNAMGPVTLRTIAAYNAEKAAVSSLGKYSVPDFTVPNGIAYVRICYSGGTYGENVQIQKVLPGESYYPYKEYEEPHYELNPDYMYKLPSTPEHVFLPTDIYVAVGRTIELYNEQIVLDHEKYHFRWVCGKGAAYKRKFSITGQTVGNYYLDLFLYDDKMNLCWKGRSTVHVVAASNPVKKILPIGDSLTNWKAWLQETILLSSNNISFVGTRYSGESRDSENNLYPSGTIHSEGRSGWAADAYLSNATYTFDNRYDGVPSVDGSANPFWDGEKFSLSHYLSVQTGVPTPDAVQIFLGTNDISDGVDVAVSNISQMVNTIRSEYPDMPIFVCNTIYRSNQNGYGSVGSDAYAGGSGASSWQYDQDSKVMELALGLRNSLANVSGIYFVPLMSCMDREYDFGQVMTKVNPRSSVEIPMPVESVHPQAVGYYQMADIMYSTYCGVLS